MPIALIPVHCSALVTRVYFRDLVLLLGLTSLSDDLVSEDLDSDDLDRLLEDFFLLAGLSPVES